jgi:dynamin 1-like protein
VVNRCQEDIMHKRSIRDALASEAAFFQSHPEYAAVASRCSTSALSHTVSSILSAHIQALLPGLAEAIGGKRNAASAELTALGDGHPETSSAQGALILTMLHKYSASVSSSLKGNAEDMSTMELVGGSRIHFILRDIFVKGLQSLDPTAALTDDDIRTAIQNSAGARSILLIPEEPFELLAKQSISKLLEPCKRCAALVHEELMRLVRRCMSAELRRYPTLARALEEEARNFLDGGAAPAEHMIVSLVQCQLAYINTSDPSFVGGTAAIALAQEEIRRARGQVATAKEQLAAVSEEGDDRQPLGPRSANAKEGGKTRSSKKAAGLSGMGPAAQGPGLVKPGTLADSFSLDDSGLTLHEPPVVLRATEPETDEEVLQVKVTRILLRSYFSIVRASLVDTVPKAVMHFLVNAAQSGLQQHLIRTLYRDDLFGDLLKEPPELATHRKHLRERLGALNEAVMTLNEVPEELRRTAPYA